MLPARVDECDSACKFRQTLSGKNLRKPTTAKDQRALSGKPVCIRCQNWVWSGLRFSVYKILELAQFKFALSVASDEDNSFASANHEKGSLALFL